MKRIIFALALVLCTCMLLTCCERDDSENTNNNNENSSGIIYDDWDEIVNANGNEKEKAPDVAPASDDVENLRTVGAISDNLSEIDENPTETVTESLPDQSTQTNEIIPYILPNEVGESANENADEMNASSEDSASEISENNSLNVQDETVQDENESFVWITSTGKKYHSNSDCSNMKNPKKVTKDYAEEKNYTPCKKCF